MAKIDPELSDGSADQSVELNASEGDESFEFNEEITSDVSELNEFQHADVPYPINGERGTDETDVFQVYGYSTVYFPPLDGHCQFNAVADAIRRIGVTYNPQYLRESIVDYMESHDQTEENPNRFRFCEAWNAYNHIYESYDAYLSQMRTCAYGESLTLHALSEWLYIIIRVISVQGDLHNRIIVPSAYNDPDTTLPGTILGHYAEDDGENYVCLVSNNLDSHEENTNTSTDEG